MNNHRTAGDSHHTSGPPGGLEVIDLGRLSYAAAFDRQRSLHEAVRDGGRPAVLLVEHEPVITVSRRKTAPGNLIASQAQLEQMGIAVEPTNRGGDITYHGPGQLVAYPIIRLADYGLNVGRYVRMLEQVIVRSIASFGVQSVCDRSATGVWVDPANWALGSGESEAGGACPAGAKTVDESGSGDVTGPQPVAKIAAIGVRVSRGVTMHGLALNVTTDLSHFSAIVPCGLVGRPVTSLAALMGEAVPAMGAVKEVVAGALAACLEEAGQAGEVA